MFYRLESSFLWSLFAWVSGLLGVKLEDPRAVGGLVFQVEVGIVRSRGLPHFPDDLQPALAQATQALGMAFAALTMGGIILGSPRRLRPDLATAPKKRPRRTPGVPPAPLRYASGAPGVRQSGRTTFTDRLLHYQTPPHQAGVCSRRNSGPAAACGYCRIPSPLTPSIRDTLRWTLPHENHLTGERRDISGCGSRRQRRHRPASQNRRRLRRCRPSARDPQPSGQRQGRCGRIR